MAESDTLNDAIRDLSVRHQVQVQRLSSGVLEKLIPMLDKSDSKIVAQLQARGPTLEGTFTSQRLQYLLQSIRQINHDAHVELGQELRQDLRDVAKYESEFQLNMLDAQTKGAVDWVAPPSTTLNAVATSRPFAGRLLSDVVKGMEASKFQALKSAVQLGVIEGQTSEEIVRSVRGTRALNYADGVLAGPRSSVERLVRTAVNHTANAARNEVYKENAKLIKRVQWVATLDTRTCIDCMDLDGETFPLHSGPRPPEHISCRCTTVPVTKTWREMGINADELPPGTRASMNGQVSETETYNSWLKKQSAEAQDEALGPTRGDLFRKGGLTVDRFTDTQGNALTLDELRKTEGAAFERASTPGLRASGPGAAYDNTLDDWARSSKVKTIEDQLSRAPANQKTLVMIGDQIAEDTGATLKDPGFKTDVARMKQKIAEKYNGDPSLIKDAARVGFIAETPAQAEAIVKKLGQSLEIVDEDWTRVPSTGYFDRKVIARFSDGQMGEIQIWPKELYDARGVGGGHALYKEQLKLDMTKAADQAQFADLSDRQRTIYTAALKNAGKKWSGIF